MRGAWSVVTTQVERQVQVKYIVLLFVLACGQAPAEHCAPACHPGNYKIVDARYQLCNELGEWEDGGEAP